MKNATAILVKLSSEKRFQRVIFLGLKFDSFLGPKLARNPAPGPYFLSA